MFCSRRTLPSTLILSVVIGLLLTMVEPLQKRFFSWTGAAGAQAGAAAKFHYETAYAFQPKDRSPVLESPSGEDNYFVAGTHNGVAAGVADGVGGWASKGLDSSAISRELCATAGRIAQHASHDVRDGLTPLQVLVQAFDTVRNEGKVTVGGTTACFASCSDTGLLQVANLGDSWCGVFRNGNVTFGTKFQTLGFNTPMQLAIIPQHILAQARRRGTSYIQNKPQEADEYEFQLQRGDIVVLATDGVIDNVCNDDIGMLLTDMKNEPLDKIAKTLVTKVRELSIDPNFPSVFAQELSKETGQYYLGGKEDDITVVLIRVD